MPYQLGWLVPNRVILVRYLGVLSSDDVQHYVDEVIQMRDVANAALGEFGPLVHTLTDATQLERYALGFNDLRMMLTNLGQQRTGWSVFVHSGIMERFFASVGHQWVGVHHREFTSLAQAVAFLKEDTTLPDFDYQPHSAANSTKNP